MRVVFFGTPQAAVPSLEALLADPAVEVAAVVTNPDRPSGRGHKLAPPPVKLVAEQAGVPVWQPAKPRERLDDLRGIAPDACAVVAYGALLPVDVLEAGGSGFVNLHFSLLPAWRGAAPVQHTILAGDEETGVTCFVLDAGMDTGPVLSTWYTRIGPEETAGELTDRLARSGAPVLQAAVLGLVDGTVRPQPQEHALATYAPKVNSRDAQLDWTRDAEHVDRMVRAFNPVPGAHTTFAGARLKVHRVRAVDADGGPGHVAGMEPGRVAGMEPGRVAGMEPGRVAGMEPGGPVVACGSGGVVLLEVQPAGKPRMPGPAFANGYRPLGSVLGDAAGPSGREGAG